MTNEKAVKLQLKLLNKKLLKQYKEEYEYPRKNPKDYEKQLKLRIKKLIRFLNPLISEAVNVFHVPNEKGRKSKLSLEQKVRILLLKQLVGKSNRMMSYLLEIFYLMFDVDISYKTIERLYEDNEVYLALHNLMILILRKKKVDKIDSSGDATCYGLSVSIHYRSYAEKLKDKAKVADYKKKKFIYQFVLMDLKTKMYVCYGTSLQSEKDAYNKAMDYLKQTGISINTIRLDRYYSNPGDVNKFKNCKIYFIPKTNVTMANGIYWNERLTEFVEDVFNYLKEYFKRNNSESQFAVDKKLFGWRISQKIESRMDTALFVNVVWKNLFKLYA